jgi:hypothetical protein
MGLYGLRPPGHQKLRLTRTTPSEENEDGRGRSLTEQRPLRIRNLEIESCPELFGD